MRKLTLVIFTLSLLVIAASNINAQNITVSWVGAGGSIYGYNGDGNVGYYTEIQGPHDVCIDAGRNIYFVDMYNFRVRKVSAANGIITTVAGGGTSSADGILATNASINPNYICIDATGNLYISTLNRIRKIDALTGIITTVAGTDSAGYYGDGGPATAALFNSPFGICVDPAGNIYVADTGNNRIRKITAATGIITTIAGNGTRGNTGDGALATAAVLYNPMAICVNAAGDVFVSDQVGTVIREIKAATGIITTIAGTGFATGYTASGDGGPATLANIGSVFGMCCDGSGNIFIDDQSCSCRKIDRSTGIINVVAGGLTMSGYNGEGKNSLATWFSSPGGVCVDGAGNIYVADFGNNRVRKAIQLTHTPSFAYGNGQSISVCPESALSINTQLAITDLDSAQTETWTVTSAPAHGTLSGFPYSRLSVGTGTLVTPTGLSYTPGAGFAGADSFKVRVSDGALSDIVTIYVSVPVTAPDPGAIASGDTVCMDNSITLSETVPGGIWSSDSAVVSVDGTFYSSVSGIVTVYYTVITGCVVTTTGSVYVNPLPDAGIISGADSIHVGNMTTLSDTTLGGTGTWASNDTTIATVSGSGVVYGVAPGFAAIYYSVSNGTCTGSSYFNFFVVDSSVALSVNTTYPGINKLTVMPNPARENFSVIASSPTDEPVTITITNIIGEKLKVITGVTNKPVDALLNVPVGLYLLNAQTAHGNMSGKIVIE